MSVFSSLLHGLDERDRDHTIRLIRQDIADDLANVASGNRPTRRVDVGTRSRARRGAAKTQDQAQEQARNTSSGRRSTGDDRRGRRGW